MTLLSRREAIAEEFQKTGRIDSALPGIDLPQSLVVSTDAGVLEGAGIVLFAMPSQAQRDAAHALSGRIGEGADVVICAKGMERESGRLLTEVVAEELHLQNVAVLSGPGFAADIAKGLPTAMVIAAETLSARVLPCRGAVGRGRSGSTPPRTGSACSSAGR